MLDAFGVGDVSLKLFYYFQTRWKWFRQELLLRRFFGYIFLSGNFSFHILYLFFSAVSLNGMIDRRWHASERGNEIWFCTRISKDLLQKCSLENHRCGWPLLFLKPAQQKFQSFRWNISCYFNVTFQAANFQIVTTCVMMVQARKERKKNGTLGRDRDLGLEITSTIQNYF